MESHNQEFVIDNDLAIRLNLLGGFNAEQKFSLPNLGKYADLINLLKEIPLEIFQAFAKREPPTVNIPGLDLILNKLKYKNFENWGETVSTVYNRILYPTETPAEEGTQVSQIQSFLKDRLSGFGTKRVRGAGIRHSWSNVFADENQFLVSLYPYRVATGTSFTLQAWAREMLAQDEKLANQEIQHLCSIRHVGTVGEGTHLIKVGAGVSNEQMRLWCIKNGYQYKSNVIMVEVNVCGAIGTCSHGAGINTQTLSDYIYEIEFIDHKGVRHTISKRTEPELILSAASNLGLLGIVIYVTLEMETLDIIEFQPRNTYKDFTVPWPKNYPNAEARKNRPEYIRWLQKHGKNTNDQDWENNFRLFKEAIHKTYCEWFYFPVEEVHVFENCFNTYGKKTQENIQKLQEENKDNVFYNEYPTPQIKFLSEFSLFVGNFFINHEKTQQLVNVFMRAPFAFFPKEHAFINYPDGVHFQRGIQNMKVRDIEVEVNVPAINGEPDYDLIQRLWWVALEIVENKKDLVNVALEMRIFKGSNATLAPEIGFDYVCSIEILRSMTFNEEQEAAWREVCLAVFEAWKNERDSNGNTVAIRPHWGKQWNSFPEIKEHVLNDEDLKAHFRKFLEDYKEIARRKKFDYNSNLKAFSNALYRELFNNAIGTSGPHLQ